MPKYRYKVNLTMTVRTDKVTEAIKAMKLIGNLVKQGIVIDSDNYRGSAQFIFTGLNKIKPEMIAEATASARKAAEKFAKDSGSKVGGIKKARQGFFSISDRDSYTPEIKKVRVVTSVDYFLL
jgi:hypothetical protein